MLNLLQQAALKGGGVILRHFKHDIEFAQKTSRHDLVTKADLESQKIIEETIVKLMKKRGVRESDIGFIGEEQLYKPSKFTFIIDPLDGTNNYASGFSYFAVSIACYQNEKPIVGVVYQPMTNTFFVAQKNQGAYKIIGKKRRKLTHHPKPLDQSLITLYLSSKEELRKNMLTFIASIFPKIRGVRILGAVALDISHLADNATNIVICARTGIWDIAAANLIIHESGGVLTDWQGKSLRFDFINHDASYPVLACHPVIISHITPYLNSIPS